MYYFTEELEKKMEEEILGKEMPLVERWLQLESLREKCHILPWRPLLDKVIIMI